MSVQVRLARSAEKELLALPLSVQRRFRAAIDDLAAHWPVLTRDVLRLKGRGDGWRLRVGDYRALFEVAGEALVFTAFLSRSTAYR